MPKGSKYAVRHTSMNRTGTMTIDVPKDGDVIITIHLDGLEPDVYAVDRAVWMALTTEAKANAHK